MSDQLRLPCRESDTPDDWFIGRDGKQFPSDDLLTAEAVTAALETVTLTLADEGYVEAVDKALARAEADAKTEALGRRRRAKEGCLDCAFRTRCLQIAIDGDEQHGTWGGYYEEEIREIRSRIHERRLLRRQ